MDLKDYDIAENTMHLVQIDRVIKKRYTKSTEAEKNLKKAQFNFMIVLKTLIYKTLFDPKMLQLKICISNEQKDRTPQGVSSVFSEITESLILLFASDRIVDPEELKRQVEVALHLEHPGSTKKPSESSIVWWSRMKKPFEKKAVYAPHTWVPATF